MISYETLNAEFTYINDISSIELTFSSGVFLHVISSMYWSSVIASHSGGTGFESSNSMSTYWSNITQNKANNNYIPMFIKI